MQQAVTSPEDRKQAQDKQKAAPLFVAWLSTLLQLTVIILVITHKCGNSYPAQGWRNSSEERADLDGFIDALGAPCSDWAGRTCTAEVGFDHGYTALEMQEVAANCPQSCNPCKPCECDDAGMLISCAVPALVLPNALYLRNRGITGVRAGVFDEAGFAALTVLDLYKNRLVEVRSVPATLVHLDLQHCEMGGAAVGSLAVALEVRGAQQPI